MELKAKAFKDYWDSSDITSGTYIIKAITPTISPEPGIYNSAKTITISTSTTGCFIKYTTDGTDPVTYGTIYSAPFTINSTKTIKASALKSGCASSDIATSTYNIYYSKYTASNTNGSGTLTVRYHYLNNTTQDVSHPLWSTESIVYLNRGDITKITHISANGGGDPATHKLFFNVDGTDENYLTFTNSSPPATDQQLWP